MYICCSLYGTPNYGDIKDIIMSKFYIHINRHHIDHNRKHPDDLKDVLTVKKGKYKKHCNAARSITLPGGVEVIYSPDGKLLPCGARCVITSPEILAIDGVKC